MPILRKEVSMQISLTTAEGNRFVFSLLPEKLVVKYTANYQGFDIISMGNVDIPRGSDVTEISWDSEFFGKSKKGLAGVDAANWREPDACVKILIDWLDAGTELTLIVSGTWINVDVTIASFEVTPHGGYGDVSYSITFKKTRALNIYTTKELKIGKKKKAKPRAKKKSNKKKKHPIKKGDTLQKIATKSGVSWIYIYAMNKITIECAAKKQGFPDSDRGSRLFAGTTLIIP